jgi:hypothetical protein
MEVSQDQLIEMGLNIIGLLAAAGLLLIISSALRKTRKKNLAIEVAPVMAAEQVVSAVSPPDHTAAAMEYVSLTSSSDTESAERHASNTPVSDNGVARRNRSEIIGLAREMLAARQTTEEISDSLPVSEAELALLSLNNGASHGEDNG